MRQVIAKSMVAALCLGLLSTSAMAAAGAAKADGRGQMMASRAVEPFRTALGKLTLTDDEKTKTDEILNDATAQVQAMVDDAKADKKDAKAAPGDDKKADNQARRAKLMELEKTTATKIEGVLTDEQKPEFKKALAEARTAARESRPGLGGGGGGRRAGAATKPTV